MAGPNARPQFQVSGLRGACWGELSLVCRERDPQDWTDVAEYDRCGFWLGLITRVEFDAARVAAGMGPCKEEQVVVSPFTDGQRVRRHGSWLSPHMRWVRFQDLTLDWCLQHLL